MYCGRYRTLSITVARTRLERQNLFAHRVEIDAPLLHVGDIAEVRACAERWPISTSPLGSLRDFTQSRKFSHVIHIDVARRLHDDGLSAAAHRGEGRSGCGRS